jgi:hypothetical protein
MGRWKLEMYRVTPWTLGSSKLSIWSVSLKTKPLPWSCPTIRGDSARAGNGLEAKAEIARDVPRVAAPIHCVTNLGTCHPEGGDTCRLLWLSPVGDIDLVVARDVASPAGLGGTLKASAGAAENTHTQARNKKFADVIVAIFVELLRCGGIGWLGCVVSPNHSSSAAISSIFFVDGEIQ